MRDLLKIRGNVYFWSNDIIFNAVGQILIRIENDEFFFQEAVEVVEKYIDESEELEFLRETLSAIGSHSASLLHTLLLSSHKLHQNSDFNRLLKKMQHLNV